MASGLTKEPAAMLDRAHLLVTGREIQPADAGEGNSAGAHRAGLQCHVEIAAREALRARKLRCLTDHQEFGMGSGVLEFQGPVAGPGDDPAPGIRHDCPHGYLAAGGGGLGFGKGKLHWLWQFQLHSAT